ncbi:uncharacterized protein KGF55_002770 [Candida pseudojiufengensis]|uniref:uncharacterized protein n=1 Tax=Candida pseudojiufengensis TaxID=497109 RepID=UPI002224CD0A|nr:uncharacterized protein KGF55_002770 [Candida pseudojiufengensis]KAI5962978.1 hypothetical protein KGF55_002770 [Candida pseudojiufengensis]
MARALIRHIFKRRPYSTTISFTPNDNRHVFESEKLTTEENWAAIPNKPSFTNIEKVHHEIINPEEVADLVTKLNTNDILVTILSQNKVLYGDPNYIIKSLTGNNDKPTIFPFSSILSSWKKTYNKQIKPLIDLEEKNYNSVDNKLIRSIRSKSFEEYFEQSRAMRNSKLISSGILHFSELNSLYTIESATSDTLDSIDSTSSFEKFLKFITPHLNQFRTDGLKDLLSKISHINKRYPTNGVAIQDIVSTINASNPSLLKSLDNHTKDNLAYVLSSTNPDLSKDLLKSLIESGICPSKESIHKYIENYKLGDQDQALRDLAFLKPTFFHRPLSEEQFEVVLATITNKWDMIKFITLLKNSPSILKDKQLKIYKKLMEFSPTKLLAAQLLRLLHDRNVTIDPEVLRCIEKDFK